MYIQHFWYNVNDSSIIAKKLKTCKYFMKFFLYQSKIGGFTLIEILVVIVLVGILAIITTSFNFNEKTSDENCNQFTSAIMNLLSEARTDAMVGRAIKSNNGTLINPASISVIMSTGAIITNYMDSTDTIIGTGTTLTFPFYNEQGYVINSFSFSWADGTTITQSIPFSIIFNWINSTSWDSITFSGISSSGVVLSIVAWYNQVFKTIEFDRRTGRIETN